MTKGGWDFQPPPRAQAFRKDNVGWPFVRAVRTSGTRGTVETTKDSMLEMDGRPSSSGMFTFTSGWSSRCTGHRRSFFTGGVEGGSRASSFIAAAKRCLGMNTVV